MILSPDQVAMALIQAQREMGANLTMEEFTGLVALPSRESGYDTNAHNPNRATGDDSYGLWQVNMLGGMGTSRRAALGIGANEALYDPVTNAKAAIQLVMDGRKRGNPLYAWGGYKGKSNTYNVSPNAMLTAQQAVQRVIKQPLQNVRQALFAKTAASGTTGQQISSWMNQQIGKPYVAGGGRGGNLDSFDCSSLMSAAYKQVMGIDIPPLTWTQAKYGTSVSKNAKLQIGDLILVHGSQGDMGHVGMYVGNGEVIDAPHTGAVVRKTPLTDWLGRAQMIRRLVDGNGNLIVGDGLVPQSSKALGQVTVSQAQYANDDGLPLAPEPTSIVPAPTAPTIPTEPKKILPDRQPFVLPGLGRYA